ncbi:MAG: 3-methylornithyl-N6-L-lysine dehydrogenase PylD [Firmicutes bacterium]|nr:3-methylornithyl-N6-L-lysine dehydrogenase PylD [Bacillota bacterium]MBR4024229.1 3-methylornithyl-N6-L-lysine dehydrogenase PylD [Bacillota bacterium]MBR6956417.1 3-methylornithyl-N6-L-lysine dehydrogenase PylD [Bacillota bacterium]
MTRLKTEWIDYMLDGMNDYNSSLKAKTGFDLAGLTMDTFGISKEKYDRLTGSLLVAAVPVTQGEGIISSFSESVAAIVRSMGFRTYVSEDTDVEGIYGSILMDADVVYMADDTRYLAFSRDNGSFGENNYATALGFIMVMRAMMKKAGLDISKEKILVIGNGLVGEEAVQILLNHGIDFDMYDKDPKAVEAFRDLDTGKYVLSSPEEIKDYRFILDFTNEGGWLKDEMLGADVIYASPGVPLSLDEKAAERLQNTAVYDNLEIGTAMMLGEILKTMP